MIPKVIHYCWFGKGEMSPLHLRCIESWKRYCPDYELRLWNEENADIDNPYCRAAIKQRKWAFVSDWVRFDVLAKHGGVYLDTDMELITSIDSVLEHAGCVSARESQRVIGAAFIACHAGDPVMEQARAIILDDLSRRSLFVSSPLILAQALKLCGPGLIHLLDQKCFYPFNPFDQDQPNNPRQLMYADVTPATLGIHHYSVSWGDKFFKRAVQRLLGYAGIKPRWHISFNAFEAARR
ncbi:glycosyltransferase family 32 protein [Janthinobacterium fluminis]|uniref:Glycosyltransferase n=1 Tax=Janthinobacterium fluminis TaxID=2987524 RepID=A0ABT5JY92_9BURK|nr:glycosyltransferase [Janthinobacterium fluminis]MDC8757609.1 glycosyltransferase [Janthinobacterium fluminis]